MPEALYIDGHVAVSDGRGTAVIVFGPFSDRKVAEQALVAFVGRENAMGAVIRDPNA